jgi:hypothetical protein
MVLPNLGNLINTPKEQFPFISKTIDYIFRQMDIEGCGSLDVLFCKITYS